MACPSLCRDGIVRTGGGVIITRRCPYCNPSPLPPDAGEDERREAAYYERERVRLGIPLRIT